MVKRGYWAGEAFFRGVTDRTVEKNLSMASSYGRGKFYVRPGHFCGCLCILI